MSRPIGQHSSVPIDPILLQNSALSPPVANTSRNDISSTHQAGLSPPINPSRPHESREAYEAHLKTFTRKDDLRALCNDCSLSYNKKDTLARLRGILADHWYPGVNLATPLRAKTRRKNKTPRPVESAGTSGAATDRPAQDQAREISDADLLAEFDVAGAASSEDLLGYDEQEDDDELEDLADDDTYANFQKKTRIAAAERFEGNRRQGFVEEDDFKVVANLPTVEEEEAADETGDEEGE
ncbi:hypothetical protein B0H11DRAFT_2260176 [Mycena galericulata]|nr:hypothetical protein B0H11DRAFT_2260176 [Mycena galericulata]